jgi:hypothetical protein
MKKLLLIIIVFSLPLAVFGQSREDIQIIVMPTTGGSPTENAFFDENLKMETVGAQYTLTDSVDKADYRIVATVGRDFDDGGFEIGTVNIELLDNSDLHQIVEVGSYYYDLEEMYNWNLYLIYQAMGNVPFTKLMGEIQTDFWRNKWLYLTLYGMYSLHVYQFTGSAGLPWDFNGGMPVGGGFGMEIHFLNWLSVEAALELTFDQIPKQALKEQTTSTQALKGDFTTAVFTVPVLGKFVWKPSKHFMIEPYGGIAFNLAINRENLTIPLLSIPIGAQWGIKLGDHGAIFLDTRVGWDLGRGTIQNDQFPDVNFHRYTVNISLGYKFGFFDRLKSVEEQQQQQQAP